VSTLQSCPCCGDLDLCKLGELHDSDRFAGARLTRKLPGGGLYRCQRCRLKFRYPTHDAGAYSALYDNDAIETWPADSVRPDWNLIVDHVLKQLPAGGRVLDFGCYSGGLLGRLGPKFDRYGVEINRAAAAHASGLIHGPVWASLDAMPADLRFDVIIAADVIEHMQNPRDLINTLSAWLSDDGILIVTTGDADNFLWNRFGSNWWYCFYPEHIVFVSRKWLDYLVATSDLVLVRCHSFRYQHQAVLRRIVDTCSAFWYGLHPVSYLGFIAQLRRVLGRPDVTSVPGNGISADHLFIVLRRKSES